MPCESCAVQFSVFRRRRMCSECDRYYCSGCLRRGGGTMCAACRVLSTRPLSRSSILHLKVRDLQSFLQRQNVSTRGCVEKEELVNLCLYHVNSTSYRRRGPRGGPFSTIKGFTNNINDLITSAFDLYSTQPPRSRNSCYNTSHTHSSRPAPPEPQPAEPVRTQPSQRFTVTIVNRHDIEVPVPRPPPPRTPSTDGPPVDTADCFEVEDLDDAGWEFVTRPAAPLPNDSEVLMTESEQLASANDPPSPSRPPSMNTPLSPESPLSPPVFLSAESSGTPQRAASALELRHAGVESDANADTNSLQDEPLMDQHPTNEYSGPIKLEHLKKVSDLDVLNVKQLKELLMTNRVEYRGCLERKDLLERARMLWADHAKFKDELDNLPLEECCKICMAAPLECVLLECGHIAACTQCGKQLAECPICRQFVVRAVRFFRS